MQMCSISNCTRRQVVDRKQKFSLQVQVQSTWTTVHTDQPSCTQGQVKVPAAAVGSNKKAVLLDIVGWVMVAVICYVLYVL